MAREVPEEESYRRADEESRIQKFNKINKENMAIIGIDFDGTCVTDLSPYVGDNIGAASVLRTPSLGIDLLNISITGSFSFIVSIAVFNSA